MKLSVNYLRTIVKNANSAIRLTSDVATIQQLTMKRETAFTAIRMLQEANKGNRSPESVSAFCAQNGIELNRTSGKDASTWDADSFGIHLKGRFGAASLERIAEKQSLGIDHGDIGVIRNLGNQYGKTVNPPREKVKHVAPTIPSKYRDQSERAIETVNGKQVVVTKVIGRAMPKTSNVASKHVETILSEAQRKGSKKLLRVARNMILSQSRVRAERDQQRATNAVMARDVVARVTEERKRKSITYPSHLSEVLGLRK